MRKELILYNMDDEPVVDLTNGKFIMELDMPQRKLIDRCISQMIPIKAFAYKSVSADIMEFIAKQVYFLRSEDAWSGIDSSDRDVRKRIIKELAGKPDWKAMGVWRLLHTRGVDWQRLFLGCFALCNNYCSDLRGESHSVDILKELDNAMDYHIMYWLYITEFAYFGIIDEYKLIQNLNKKKGFTGDLVSDIDRIEDMRNKWLLKRGKKLMTVGNEPYWDYYNDFFKKTIEYGIRPSRNESN